MQPQTQPGSVAGMPKQPKLPTMNTNLSPAMAMAQDPVAEGLNMMQSDANKQQISQPTPTPVTETSVKVQQPIETQVPIVANKQKQTAPVPVATQQPVQQEQPSDIVGKGPKQGLIQQRAEKSGLVKDGSVVDQKKLNNFAIQRSSDIVKNIASRGEKVDEARLNEIYDTTLGSMGIKAGTPQYMEAMKSIQGAYMDSIKNSGFTSVEQSLNSLNSQYNKLSGLKTLSPTEIERNMSNYTPEEKEFLKQNNPQAYAQAQAKADQKKKTDEMNAEMTGNYTKAVEEVTNPATRDFDQYVNTKELQTAESQLTKRDKQIAELQAKLDPETLKNDIMSRYSKSLSSGALDALYYDEANDKNRGLQTLLAQKEMAQAEYKRIREENLQRYEVVKQNENQIVSSLMANGGAGLSSTSFKDIDQYVKDGYMTEGTAKALKSQVNGMTISTMKDMGIVDQKTVKQIQQMAGEGMSPNSIITSLIATGQYLPQAQDKYDVIKMGDNSWIQTRNGQVISQGSLADMQSATGASAQALNGLSWVSGIQDGSVVGQCGKFVNDYLQKAGLPRSFGDSLESKVRLATSQTPAVGSVMVLDSKSAPNNGHVAVVESINGDGTINIVESNRGGDEKLHRRVVDPKKTNIYGYMPVGQQRGSVDMLSIDMPEKATEYKLKSKGYADRMLESDKKLKDFGLEDTYIDRTIAGQTYQERAPQYLKSTDQKDLDIYKKNFVTAVLRQESGASISPTEFDNEDKKYFPQPGDSKETLQKKQQMRQLAIRTMYQSAGNSADGQSLSSVYDSLYRLAPQENQTETTTDTSGTFVPTFSISY